MKQLSFLGGGGFGGGLVRRARYHVGTYTSQCLSLHIQVQILMSEAE